MDKLDQLYGLTVDLGELAAPIRSLDSLDSSPSPMLAVVPSAVQFRVWRWENGLPIGLGVIGVNATEVDFIDTFYSAMPAPGDGGAQYRLRPIDERGREIGQEITLRISEKHPALRRKRGL